MNPVGQIDEERYYDRDGPAAVGILYVQEVLTHYL